MNNSYYTSPVPFAVAAAATGSRSTGIMFGTGAFGFTNNALLEANTVCIVGSVMSAVTQILRPSQLSTRAEQTIVDSAGRGCRKQAKPHSKQRKWYKSSISQ